MAYGLSNSHVTDDVTWPWKVKLVTPIRLERHISKTTRARDFKFGMQQKLEPWNVLDLLFLGLLVCNAMESVSEHNVVKWVLCISGNTIDKDRRLQSIILLNLDMLLS